MALSGISCQGGAAAPAHATLGEDPSPRSQAMPGAGAATDPALGAAHAGRAGVPIRTPHYVLRVSAPDDCSPPGHGRTAESRRLGIQVEIEPTGEVQVPANPYYARLVDGLGNVYEATLGGCGPPLAPTLPGRGQTARGWIVFEVPSGARDFTLSYAPPLVGAREAEIGVALGR